MEAAETGGDQTVLGVDREWSHEQVQRTRSDRVRNGHHVFWIVRRAHASRSGPRAEAIRGSV